MKLPDRPSLIERKVNENSFYIYNHDLLCILAHESPSHELIYKVILKSNTLFLKIFQVFKI